MVWVRIKYCSKPVWILPVISVGRAATEYRATVRILKGYRSDLLSTINIFFHNNNDPERNLLLKIILMRHGKPALSDTKKISASTMTDWIKQYDLSDIGDDLPSQAILAQVNRPLKIFSSSLPRAISSARALKLAPEVTDELFREAELPVFPVPLLKLSPFQWAVIFRALWLCGWPSQAESLAMAKLRARRSAELLVNTATQHQQSVLLTGHGIINRLIASELKSQGWEESFRSGKGHWGARVFELPAKK